MTDFEKTRKQLETATRAQAKAEADMRQALAALSTVRTRKGGPRRGAGSGGTADLDRLRDALARGKERFDLSKAALEAARRAFEEFSDPTKAIGRLPDNDPFLLFPVRIETRFMRRDDTGRVDELLVRIYPDSALIDTFEPVLTAAELDSARRFHLAFWQANGDEARRRAAFAGLVQAHGTGRARWIIESYGPINSGERPERGDGSVALVLVLDEPLGAADRAAAAAFWTRRWASPASASEADAAFAELEEKVGRDLAARIAVDLAPVNLGEQPAATPPPSPPAFVAFLELPPDPPVRQQSWSGAPRADPMPDRFVLMLETNGKTDVQVTGKPVRQPLFAGFDPTGSQGGVPVMVDGGLAYPEETRWMADFDEAVDAGMAFRVPLDPRQAATGFDRLLVLGINLTFSGEKGAAKLEEMIAHRLFSTNGIALVPQGTPTNNTEDRDAGWSRVEDPEDVFDLLFGEGAVAVDSADPRKPDGQHLAEALGISPKAFQRVSHADGRDQAHARAVNAALWPATLGYYMTTLMNPVFDETTIDLVRRFFVDHVSGRGPVPAIRIGRQPYGILPTSNFRSPVWMRGVRDGTGFTKILPRLHGLILKGDEIWEKLADRVDHVGDAADPQQALLNILGLHPDSAEFHYRFAESSSQVSNFIRIAGLNFASLSGHAAFRALTHRLLVDLGCPEEARPQIERLHFHDEQGVLDGGVAYTKPPRPDFETEHRRYVRWLIDAARKGVTVVQQQRDMPDGKPPRALAYIMLRHALLVAYGEAGRRLHLRDADLVGSGRVSRMALEEPLPHLRAVRPQAFASESKWDLLFSTNETITREPRTRIADFLTREIGRIPETRDLSELLEAFSQIETMTHEELDRAFREHVDTASYRLDAWATGIVGYQLETMRPRRTGTHLGAYGWLEDVRPVARKLTPKKLDEAETKLADPAGTQPPLVSDSASGGLIQAPSLNQAVTAAILRSAYRNAPTAAERDALGINLSSQRVRDALFLADGMRNGQKLGALLGYRFERALHDGHRLSGIDQFLPMLRHAFPLVADRLKTTRKDGTEEGSVAARNVVDGLRLVETMERTGVRTYPFGVALPPIPTAAAAAITREARKLEDLHDALGDLMLAESVHQSVLGNYDRVAASLDPASRAALPPEPDVVRTPSTGIEITHRVAVHLDPTADAAEPGSPRTVAEPSVEAWLRTQLPPLGSIGCLVEWDDTEAGERHREAVTIGDLGMSASDLVYAWQADDTQSFAEIDDRVLHHAATLPVPPRGDSRIDILYRSAPDGGISLFDCAPLIQSLAELLRKSRPLRPTDLIVGAAADANADLATAIDPARVDAAMTIADELREALADEADTVDAVLAAGDDAALANATETLLIEVPGLLVRALSFGIARARSEGIANDARRIFRMLFDAIDARAGALAESGAACQAKLDLASAPGLDEAERMRLLREAEIALPTVALSQATTSAALATEIEARRQQLAAERAALVALGAAPRPTLGELVAGLDGWVAASTFHHERFTTEEARRQVRLLVEDMATVSRNVAADLEARTVAAAAKRAAADEAADPRRRLDLMTEAATAIFGEAFRILPAFALDAAGRTEVEQALAASRDGNLFRHLTEVAGVAFPADEWLYGVARVREPLAHVERLAVMGEALGAGGFALAPMQFPHRAGDVWLGLDYPESYDIDGSRLLYTAHLASPKLDRLCGLLLDEWSEVIPGIRNDETVDEANLHRQTSGVAFHFDRPNAEAPQALLLVTPTAGTGAWTWDDLTGALGWTWSLARKRAVEPDHLEGALGQLLPATMTATAARDITISAVLAANIDVASFMRS